MPETCARCSPSISGTRRSTYRATFYVAVDLNTETWRWDANIHIGSRPLELPDAPDLSARTPTRAAGKALEYLLERADRDDLPK